MSRTKKIQIFLYSSHACIYKVKTLRFQLLQPYSSWFYVALHELPFYIDFSEA
jgi:hypothetical protein